MSVDLGEHNQAGDLRTGNVVGRDLNGVTITDVVKLIQSVSAAQTTTTNAVVDLRREIQSDMQRLQSEFALYRTMDDQNRSLRQANIDTNLADMKSSLRGLSSAIIIMIVAIGIMSMIIIWLMLKEIVVGATAGIIPMVIYLLRML